MEVNTPHISIKAEPLFHILGFTVTNSLLTSWIVMALLVLITYLYNKKKGPVYYVVDMLLRALYGLFQPIFGEKITVFFPLAVTFFLYILTLNWFGLLPGINTIGFKEGNTITPFLRGGTADLNTTFAMSIIAMVLVQYFGIRYLGAREYLGKFFNLTNPVKAFVGILELISQFSSVLSFSFRLFGNIFAGEVLMTVVSFLIPVLASFPFLVFEFFVGFIQALVFSMLTSIFISVAIAHEEH